MKKILIAILLLNYILIFSQDSVYGRKEFDKDYILLEEMFTDDYYPEELVTKIKSRLDDLIEYIESADRTKTQIQKELDELTIFINDIQEDFWNNDSEIDTIARESIAETIIFIINYFSIDIDIETALRMRDW